MLFVDELQEKRGGIMNKWTELELLKETLEEVLGNDEYKDVLYYLNEYKRLKKKELKDVE